MKRSGRLALVTLAFSALGVAVVASGVNLFRQRSLATTAAENVMACQLLAAKITQLRDQPSHAAADPKTGEELTRRIEGAAKTAAIPPSGLLRIGPQPSRRVRDTAYLEQPVTVELRAVTLEQLARFLLEATAGESALRVTHLRLTAPRSATSGSSNDAPEEWSVELTLTHLVYFPQNARPV